MDNEKKLTRKEQIEVIRGMISELQNEVVNNKKLLNKQMIKKYCAWVCVLITLLSSGYLLGKKNSQKNELEASLNAQLANANNRIEYLVDTYERYRLVDVFVFTTTYNDGMIKKELVTYDKYNLPGLTCNHFGKAVFDDYNILHDFDYFGEETLFFSVRSGKMCGNMIKIHTHDNGSTLVTGKYTQISFNGDTQIKQVINNGDLIISSINKNDGVKFDISELRKVEGLENKTYTKEELIEIEDMLNEKSKKRVLG